MKKILLALVLLSLLVYASVFIVFFKNNIQVSAQRKSINIPTGAGFEQVMEIMSARNVLQNEKTFRLTAQFKGYPASIKPGHYVFNRRMSNRELVNMLKSGNQTPVKLVIYNIRTKEEFAGLVGRTLEIDSTLFLAKLCDEKFCACYGLDTFNILALFVTDNYEFKWNTSLEHFMSRMTSNHKKFWQGERLARAITLGLNPAQVVTLAAIVEKECIFDKELPTVAGVYLNRLKIGMPLQADPTLIFALRDFEAKRVMNYHKEFSSPYNTYQHTGLPPGPICMPRKKSIDAVLHAEQHDYLYFCANPDMSGYSIFSKTLNEHNRVAAMYHKKMNEMGVR